MTSGVTAGLNISYDKAFDTRVSADIKVRFGGAATTAQRKEVQQLPVINALTSTPSYRDVRVHDDFRFAPKEDGQLCKTDNDTIKGEGLYVACLLDFPGFAQEVGLPKALVGDGGNLERVVNRAQVIIKYCGGDSSNALSNQPAILECVKTALVDINIIKYCQNNSITHLGQKCE